MGDTSSETVWCHGSGQLLRWGSLHEPAAGAAVLLDVPMTACDPGVGFYRMGLWLLLCVIIA